MMDAKKQITNLTKCKEKLQNRNAVSVDDLVKVLDEAVKTIRELTGEPEPMEASIAHYVNGEYVMIDKKRRKRKCDDPRKFYGEHKNVLLSDSDYNDLVCIYGENELKDMIFILDEAIQIHGYKYKDFKLVLKGWVRHEYERRGRSVEKQNRTATMLNESYDMLSKWAAK